MLASFTIYHLIFSVPALIIALFLLTSILIPFTKLKLFQKKGMTFFYFPVIGYLRNWKLGYKESGDFFNRFKRASEIYPNDKVLNTNLGNRSLVLLRDADIIKDFYRKQQYYIRVGGTDFLTPLFGSGLVFAEGDTWKHHRRIISNFFHYEALKSWTGLVQATTKEFLNKVDPKGTENYSVINKIQEITGEVVGRIFFGEYLGNYSFENKPLTIYLAELIADLSLISNSATGLFLGPKFLKLVPEYRRIMKRIQGFRQLCHKIITDRKAQKEKGSDLLTSLLMTQQAENPEDRMSDTEIVNEFTTFFVAGMDTTGHLIGMTLYILTQYPEYLERLKKERETLYNPNEKVDLENINKMEELHCLLKEVLRFYTPAPLIGNRLALQDHKLGEIDIPKGMLVKPDYFAVMFHEKHWNEAHKFNPERWRGDGEKVHSYAFTPFSAGPRNCIGQHLAIMEAKIIICEFLEKFDYKLKDGYQLKMVFRFLHEPEDELLFDLKPKKEDIISQ